ncbi:MAG: four helix bundle suffix domain-containing protein [Ignavibacteriaceae bacterium]|nr:four helix bundle suffix domain-containing protein [Ignavibacteriaceae bacterium]
MEDNNKNTQGFIPKHGGYRKLKSYQKAEIIYDGTIYFTKRFFKSYDRTVDQMVQAARSGKQNIAEASMASATSKETEIKLTNVARASLEELRIDYEDFIRKNNYQFWDLNHELVARLRELNKIPDATYETFRKAIENENPEICANTMIGLIRVASFLLNNQIKSLEESFVKEGGLREKMTKVRLEKRNNDSNMNQ